eukprot:TRINITY_DN3693_c0_g1_i1.p1 TRINITY_DN3693_c0_g1~~TRINITY_DN3693_c0_g1_i1.p1  ORF type:complete len:123 (-),score=19.81 TRINITY_DN3693_c0_g1_i1:41-409(-)
MANKLEPFDYNKHKPQDVGLGGPSTEYLVTLDSPDGGVWVVPSIWWDEEGNPTLVENQDKVFEIAKQYEKETMLCSLDFLKENINKQMRLHKLGQKQVVLLKDYWLNDVSKRGKSKKPTKNI